ncbi:MAG: hydroxymethylglutaryl-CoA lyase [Polyangiaceae bacterium]|nr:hydroxymethylglutaryl-CoA lyase [Polyangiaceae bacterium]
MLDHLPDQVSIYEVSPRDGLQNERHPVSLEGKQQLIGALLNAGLTRIEITSFVSPRWIPQLADSAELAEKCIPPAGVRFSALVPNSKGLERAIAVGMKEVAVFLSASETHNRKNTNKTIEQALSTYQEVIDVAKSHQVKVRGYISTVWGCPYEGAVDVERVAVIAKKLIAMGCYEISLGDTIGVGTPLQTREICQRLLSELPSEQLALHLHDTRGTALSNALVGLEMGLRTFDTSIAGVGGCPYAPGAAGNLATEDLVYMLHGMGVHTGVDLPKLIEAGNVAESVIGRRLPGKVHLAGPFERRSIPPQYN